MTPYIRCSPLNTVKIIKAFKFKTDFSLNIPVFYISAIRIHNTYCFYFIFNFIKNYMIMNRVC